jgi:Mg2+ and Co2+ transporter CorA
VKRNVVRKKDAGDGSSYHHHHHHHSAGGTTRAARGNPFMEPERRTTVSMLAMRQWCVTVHSEPFQGLAESLKRAHANFMKANGGGGGGGGGKADGEDFGPPGKSGGKGGAAAVRSSSPAKTASPSAAGGDKPSSSTRPPLFPSALSPKPPTGGADGDEDEDPASLLRPENSRLLEPMDTEIASLRHEQAQLRDKWYTLIAKTTTIGDTAARGGAAGLTSTTAGPSVMSFGKSGSPPLPPPAPAPALTPTSAISPATALQRQQQQKQRGPLMTPAWLVATLMEYNVEASVPDPKHALSEVDAIDEMILTVGARDRSDMLRRVARLRHGLSERRATLFRKEQLLLQFLASSMRSSMLMRHEGAADHYRGVLVPVTRSSERLHAAREMLQQASSTFMTQISLEQAQVSNEIDSQMRLLAQVSAICMPANILTGLFGCNFKVPYFVGSEEGAETLTPFWVMVTVMLVWMAVTISICVWYFRRDAESTAKAVAAERASVEY